ncbi:MAG: ion transporter [Candidatus Hydrogenedentes bacterium]|nr:ion transporter [Candidatus Hydrogenedentota bacterium]
MSRNVSNIYQRAIQRTFSVLEGDPAASRLARAVNALFLILIFANLAGIVIGSVKSIQTSYGPWFDRFELVSVVIFTVEYGARLWCCVVSRRYWHPITGRARFALTPMLVVDLAAIAPFYLSFVSVDLIFLRVLRVLRLLRIARLHRYASAFKLLVRVIRTKREELVLTMSITIVLLLVSSCVMYEVETAVQPEKFADIPTTMWWAICTLTTVGYGDVYPITGLGRLVGAIVSVLGIGIFALPTGIIGAGLVEQLDKRSRSLTCPHCGARIENLHKVTDGTKEGSEYG